MLRLSKLTDYAVVVLVRLSEEGGLQSSAGIAAAIGVPEPTVAKVLKSWGPADSFGPIAGRGAVTGLAGRSALFQSPM